MVMWMSPQITPVFLTNNSSVFSIISEVLFRVLNFNVSRHTNYIFLALLSFQYKPTL
jgi:hypothetical protein